MRSSGLLILGCLGLVLVFGDRVPAQKRKPPPQKPTGSKTTTPPSEPPKAVKRKEIIAEKIVLDGICRSPNLFFGSNASRINLAREDRSEPRPLSGSFPRELTDAIRVTQMWKHSASAWGLTNVYESGSYKTTVFPETYKKNEAVLQALSSKNMMKDSVSSSDRSALYQVVKAYFIDTAIALRDTKSSMQGNLATAYKEYETAIEALANSRPEVGLSTYSDREETQVLDVVKAALIDIALVMRDSTSKIGNFAAAYEKNKAQIESLAAKNWKADKITDEETKAFRSVMQACAVDVANLFREAYKTSNKGAFGEAYGKNASDIESLAGQKWENSSRAEFVRSGPEFVVPTQSLCQVLTAYRGEK